MKTSTVRPQWPHTIDDIVKSLQGVWGLVGATDTEGNLMRLERSLHEPRTYTLTKYKGDSEADILFERQFRSDQQEEAIKEFALAIGFKLS